MPHKSPHPCSKHGWILITSDTGCSLCAGQPVLERPRPVDTRLSPAQRGYGPEWKRKRDVYARRHPWCEDPDRRHPGKRIRMKIVDHIKPKSLGGKDDDTNYQSLCQGCHNHKTARDGSRKGRGE